MNIKLPRSTIFTVLMLLFAFVGGVNAQCTITGIKNASFYACTKGNPSTSTLNSCMNVNRILYIGDGTTSTILNLDVDLDLTCLGAIIFVIKNNAVLNFDAGNNPNVMLAAGSSIVIEPGGHLKSQNDCSSSDRITIGNVKVASCNPNSNSSELSFSTLENQGGYNIVRLSPSTVCGAGTYSFTASTFPASTSTYSWYSSQNGLTSLFEGNPYTTSISATTTFYVKASALSFRFPVVVTMKPLPSLTVVNPPTVCSPSTVNITSSTVQTTNTGSSTGYYTTLALADAGGVPNVGTPAAISSSGTYYIRSETIAGCFVVKSVVVTVNPRPAAPTLGTPNQPTCTISTGSVFLSGLPAGMWTINQAGQAVNTINGSGATTTISGLAVGNYTFTVDNGSCTSNASDPLTITDVNIPTNRWTGSWDNGKPTLDQKIVFETTYDSNEDVNGCSCVVNSGVDVKVGSGATMKIVNQVEVYGKLTFLDKSSLVQINDNAANSGKITYKRFVTGIKANDYIYWSTPVGEQILGDFSPSTKYLWNTDVSNWRVPVAGDMVRGRGYIIRRSVAGDFTGSFFGTPNNGNIPIAVGKLDSFNLIGNPYPSAIDADKFLNHNSAVLGGTIYFWTHITAITERENLELGTAGSGNLAYTSNDYASYNPTGGVTTKEKKAKSDSTTDDDNKYKPTGKIAAGQAFFVTSIADNQNALFNNSMRLDASNKPYNNTQFFKINSNSKTSNTIEKNRVWLNLTNAGGAFKQTLIGYITGAKNEFDNVHDGVSFNANAFIDFYSINKGKNLVIQGRALPFDDNDTVPLGYKTTIIGEFKIAIDEADGFLANKKIILEDKLLDKTQDLSEAAYTFTTEKGTFNDRFVLSYANKTLATADFEAVENRVVITNKNKEVKISTPENQIEAVFIYDILGRQIYTKTNVDKNELVVTTLIARDQVLIVKVVMKDKSTITKKTMY